MANVEQIKRRSRFLSDEHAAALVHFTERRFISQDGKEAIVFKRRPDQESEANPFVVFKIMEHNGEEYDARSLHSSEWILLAECLLRK